MLSDSFALDSRLIQGCILSPLLFFLYIKSIVDKLRGAGVSVKWGMVATLLYADDAVFLAENEEQVKRGLRILDGWCREWAIEVKVEKCGVMHMRRSVKKTGDAFFVNDEKIKVVE